MTLGSAIKDGLERFHVEAIEELGWATKVLVTYRFPDPHGGVESAAAKLLFPRGFDRNPLFFQTRFELSDAAIKPLTDFGLIVANSIPMPDGSLDVSSSGHRSFNQDIALLHIVRSLPSVDDARVVLGGSSSGGYIAWMLAAESFPIAGLFPDSSYVNSGHLAWYLNEAQCVQELPESPQLPAINTAIRVFGHRKERDPNGSLFRERSPVHHAERITCPFQAMHATGDVVVPMDQIAPSHVVAVEGMHPEFRTIDDQPWTTLVDAFPAMEIHVVEPPAGSREIKMRARRADQMMAGRVRPRTSSVGSAGTPLSLPDNGAWQSLFVLKDGAATPTSGHTRHRITVGHGAFLNRVLSNDLDIDRQATTAKVAQLHDRRKGTEWIRTHKRHLDFPEAERADVQRSLAYLD